MSGFAIPACANCGHAVWPPRLACAVCGAADWTEVPAPTGTLLEVTEAPGYDGKPIRLGTVRLDVERPAVPGAEEPGKGNSLREGPPAIAAVDPGIEAGDRVTLELLDGALHARPS